MSVPFEESDRAFLNGNVIICLAERGRYLETGEAAISDKSTANVLVRSLACLQICLMLVQCASRNASGGPLGSTEHGVERKGEAGMTLKEGARSQLETCWIDFE